MEIKPTGQKAYLVSLDGQYRRDIATPDVEDKSGFGDRSQKNRGFIQTLALGQYEKGHEEHTEKHHLRKRYTQ